MSYARINRGPMAADVLQRDFTQIHNRLFRDPRLSFKAKGIFGLISTHRNGYGVTPEWLAASSTDGPAAVRTGLRELEAYGYLIRSQDRKPDGTMGQMTYSITDIPRSEPVGENRQPDATCDDTQTPRSEPDSDYPHADEPQAADRTHKKTSSKHTSGENTNRPSFRGPVDEDSKDGGTDGAKLPQQIVRNPGVDLLLAIGAEKPEFLLTGPTLQHQGLTVAGMLLEGWTEAHLRQVIAGRPLPSEIKTSVGALIGGRLRDAFSGPAPSSVPPLPGEYANSEESGTWTPDEWSPSVQQSREADAFGVECVGQDDTCGRPVVPGSQLCRSCLDLAPAV